MHSTLQWQAVQLSSPNSQRLDMCVCVCVCTIEPAFLLISLKFYCIFNMLIDHIAHANTPTLCVWWSRLLLNIFPDTYTTRTTRTRIQTLLESKCKNCVHAVYTRHLFSASNKTVPMCVSNYRREFCLKFHFIMWMCAYNQLLFAIVSLRVSFGVGNSLPRSRQKHIAVDLAF